MALRLELWARGRVIDGAEMWWDDVALALGNTRSEPFPLLTSIDPYEDTSFASSELVELVQEARRLRAQAPKNAGPLLDRLADLCVTGMSETDAKLRIIGD